jgi:hypothetical protein
MTDDDRDERGRFQPGNHLSPGRKKGSRVEFAEKLVRDFTADWITHGSSVIETVRKTNPVQYLALAAKLVPSDYEARIIVEHVAGAEEIALAKDFVKAFRQRLAAVQEEPLIIDGHVVEEATDDD